jgi:hypothetical protein
MPKTTVPSVFISSTLEDLEDYREKTREAILRLGWLPIDCGYSTAPSALIRAGCLAWLRRTCETVELLGLDMKDSQNVRL